MSMKKLAVPKTDTSALVSNLLIVSAVAAALTPIILGDRLVVITSDFLRHASILLQEFSVFLQRLLG
jgi:hypothetical protein